MDSFEYLERCVTKDTLCTKQFVQRKRLTKKESLPCRPLNKVQSKRIAKCTSVWSVAMNGAETWTLRNLDERRMRLEAHEECVFSGRW